MLFYFHLFYKFESCIYICTSFSKKNKKKNYFPTWYQSWKKVFGSFFFLLLSLHCQPLPIIFVTFYCHRHLFIAIIATSQNILERHVGNCMESHNQGLRTPTRVTRNLETPKTLGSTSTPNSPPFTKEQLDLLYKIMGKSKVSSSSTSCTFAQSSTFKTTLSTSSILHSNTWIIDSGATNHMTKESNVFLSYIPYSSNQKVQVAKGSLT